MKVIKEASYNGLTSLLKRIKTTSDAMVLLEHKQHSSEGVYKLLGKYKKTLEKEAVELLEESGYE